VDELRTPLILGHMFKCLLLVLTIMRRYGNKRGFASRSGGSQHGQTKKIVVGGVKRTVGGAKWLAKNL